MKLTKKDAILILVLNLIFIYGYKYLLEFTKNFNLVNGLLILLLILVLFLFRLNFRELEKGKRNNFNDVFYALLLFFPIAFLGRLLLPEFDIFFNDAYNLSNLASYFMFMLLSLLPLLKEEIIERASQFKLSNAYGSKTSIIFVSLNFALLHFIFSNLYFGFVVSISVFLGSLVLTSFFERTRNFLFVYLVHVIYDFIAVMQIFLHLNYPFYEWIFWGIYGLLFLIFVKKAWVRFRQGVNIRKQIKLGISDWIFLALLGLLPILTYFLGKMFIS